MERIRLTPQRISGATCPTEKKQAFLWDTESPRLAVRVTAGSKSFIFEGKLNRNTIRRTIGTCTAWTVEDARIEANKIQALLDKGIDPREQDKELAEQKAAKTAAKEAAKVKAEDRKRYTLKALCLAYMEHLEAQGKTKSVAATRSAFKCHVFDPHPTLADTCAAEVTAHHIAAIVRQVMEAGKYRMAGILRSYLSAAFNAAKKSPYDANLPASLIPFNVTTNPVEPVATIPIVAGNRTLSEKEMKAYICALGDSLHDQALKLALFSGGQRMAQLIRATVSDYDIKTQMLRLYDTKGKRTTPREHLLPLAPKAASIVEELVKRADGRGSALLFSSRESIMHFSTPGQRAKEIAAMMGGESFDLRDIRRTCETMMAGMGLSLEVRSQLLSHGISGVQAVHYDRHSYTNEKRGALIRWERHLDAISTEQPEQKIVNINR